MGSVEGAAGQGQQDALRTRTPQVPGSQGVAATQAEREQTVAMAAETLGAGRTQGSGRASPGGGGGATGAMRARVRGPSERPAREDVKGGPQPLKLKL